MENKIIEVSVDKIRSDPNQPRKTFDKDKIKQLSQTYKNQGVINAIEIDENNMIITGERRWRAVKLTELKTIPCKIIKGLSKSEKFERQIVENYHLKELDQWELAKAWWKLYTMLYPEEAKMFEEACSEHTRAGGNKDFKIREFSNRIGVSEGRIKSNFNALEFKKKEPEVAAQVQPYAIAETRSLPHEARKEVLKELAEPKHITEREKTIDGIREKVRDKKREINAEEILEQKDLNKKLIQSKTWVNNFRSSVTDSNQILERTFKMLLIATKFISIMDDTQKQRLNHDLDRLTDTLQKGEKMADKIKEMIE